MMKLRKQTILIAIAGLWLGACENVVVTNSKVHEDGSIDRTIILGKEDSAAMTKNQFGINEATGWETTIRPTDQKDKKESDELDITFSKSFESAEAMNIEMDREADSLFRVNATFEKQFRWFYTYITYTETVRPIDRLKYVNPDDYFNREDHAFIDRLPGEGQAISRADSLYLQLLNEKIFEHYAEDGIFAEEFAVFEEIVRRNTHEDRWLDTLRSKRSYLYEQIRKMDVGDLLDHPYLTDSLHIPIDEAAAERDLAELTKDLKSRMDFMGYARDGKYLFSIEMPWTIMQSNADSVAGNTLYWKPLVTKLAIRDFTMTTQSRQFNWWAAAITVVLISVTIYLFARRKPG